MRLLSHYLIGVIFGLGITVAGMANPAKVLNFFDLAGTWDPSLLLVMVSALTVTFVGYRLVLARAAPFAAPRFHLPTASAVDRRLIGGSALFGLGWGIAGFCPGGALPALGTARLEVFIFVLALILGIVAARTLQSRSVREQSAR